MIDLIKVCIFLFDTNKGTNNIFSFGSDIYSKGWLFLNFKIIYAKNKKKFEVSIHKGKLLYREYEDY